MIHAYTGDGKGKSTAAIGLLIRAFGAGKKVGIILFDKGSMTYRHHELSVFERLGIEFQVTGLERMKKDGSFRFKNIEEDSAEAQRGLQLAQKAIAKRQYDLLVLDEILTSNMTGLLDEAQILSLLESVPPELELVMTGRCSAPELLERADLVTNMTKKKHYFETAVV
jgi:cob(I)alamin adenosyltransferase